MQFSKIKSTIICNAFFVMWLFVSFILLASCVNEEEQNMSFVED